FTLQDFFNLFAFRRWIVSCECPHRLSDSVVKERGNREASSGLRGCVSYAFRLESQAFIFAFLSLPSAACFSSASVSGGAL
ncbi:hypothetical protein, partial [Xenorhabdus mauleonii]|uniref:hypothetical protein n=2 Tax=Xenorhabdus mauleonii TaxID=351675 RepID=UPI001B80C6CD